MILMMLAPYMLGAAEQNAPGALNILKNGSFEEKSDRPPKGCRRYFLESWTILLNSGADKCDAELSEDAYDGKYSLKLISKEPGAFVSAQQKIEVSPGQEITASVYVKGTVGAKAYMRFYLLGSDGKRMKKYFMPGMRTNAKWQPLKEKFKVPDGVTGIIASVQTLANKMPAEVYFDKFEVNINSGTMLENKLLRIQINPLVGGGIDSFVHKETGFDFTMPNLPTSTGGMALDILPGNRNPGLFRLKNYIAEVLQPYRQVRVSRTVHTEEFRGLKVIKTFLLEESDSFVKVNVELVNSGDRNLEFEYRVHNCIRGDDGVFTWPTADWLQAFRKTPQAVQAMNTIITENMRFGWCAKTYAKPRDVLLFKFPGEQVYRNYSWVSEKLDTIEWYYRKIKLKPGESWKTEYSIGTLPVAEELYTGGIKGHIVYIEGVKLPEPQGKRELPKIMQGYFPFGGSAPSSVCPASAGSFSRKFHHVYSRAMREMAYNYFNFYYSLRMMQAKFQVELIDKDGKAVVGELARKYDMMLAPNHLLYQKSDIDVEAFRPILQKRIEGYYTPKTLKFVRDYHDRILCYFTGDETLAQNITCMLEAHDALKNKIDPDGAYFPYLDHDAHANIPYVPVFLGNWYAIRRPGYRGRDPWSIARVIKEAVKKAGDTPPVWFMPQGFGSNHAYALPTAAEMRLMLYLSVANGAKGIIFHGIQNGAIAWRYNYYYHYSPYGNAGQRTEAWYAISDCAKQLTAVGPLLYYTRPELMFTGIEVKSAHFKNNKNFYDGPAITVNSLALNNDAGRFLVVINQDDTTEQAGEITFNSELGKLSLYNLTQMKKSNPAETLKVRLRAGDAEFYFLGPEAVAARVFAEVCGNRYLRERVRYLIDAECASDNGVDIKAADALAQQAAADYLAKRNKGAHKKSFWDWRRYFWVSIPAYKRNEDAYSQILQAQSKLQEILGTTEFGQTMRKMEEARVQLDEIDFMFLTHLDLVMPPELREKAPRHRTYKNTTDPKMQELVDAIAQDFFDYWKLDREIREGRFEQIQNQVEQLIGRIPGNVKAASDYLKANEHKIKVDNPYK